MTTPLPKKLKRRPKPAVTVNPVAKALKIHKPKVMDDIKAYKRRPRHTRSSDEGGDSA